jgi:hypothetical protein
MTLNLPGEETQSTVDTVSNGLVGRIIENWLTSATERSYQLPFCQLLAAEGETLLYIARHGAFEKGKDVITRVPDGSIRAYQLKCGDVRLADWREIDTQINNLVELPVVLPGCDEEAWHFPCFVTNGRVDDVVIDYINAGNIGWAKRRFPNPLQVIEKEHLVRRFLNVHGAYLPKETKDFQAFLTLLLRDGTAPLDKAAFSSFIEKIIPFDDESLSNRNASRAISSMLLLATYILGSSESCNNHWALFEGWVLISSYILSAATRFALEEKFWRPSYEIAMLGADRSLDDLVVECRDRTEYFEGHPLADGYFYRTRQMMLAGLLATWSLSRRQKGLDIDASIQRKMRDFVRNGFIWGESAAPFIFSIALELEQECNQLTGERIVIDFLRILLFSHGEHMRGMPDIFASIEDSVRYLHQITESDRENYAGFSYAIEPCIDYLARRWRRQALTPLWNAITRISLEQSIPGLAWEWFWWRADSAQLMSSIPGQPQSWTDLRNAANARDIGLLPNLLTSQQNFLLYFLVVFPHRLTLNTLFALDTSQFSD